MKAKRMKKMLIASVSCLLVISLMVGCSNSNGTSGQQTSGGIVNIVMWSAPDNFNPYFSNGNYGKYAAGELVLNALIKYDPEYEFIPGLAKEWEMSEDGKEYTFYLQETNWHDGVPFTAEDVAFTLKSIMHPDWTGTGYKDLKLVVGAEEYKAGTATDVPGVEIVDEHTIKIKLTEAYAPFMEAVGRGLWILPAHAFEDVEVGQIDKADFSRNPFGTGPLKFVKYVTDQYVEYETNKDYFLGAPKFDKVILKIMSPDLALAAFEKGELDATTRVGIGTINLSDYDKINSIENVDVTVFDTMAYQTMTINVTKPYLADQKVRQAMAFALNRQGIVDQLLQGMGNVAHGPLAAESPWFNENVTKYEYNPEKAKELLAEAGWNPSTKLVLSVPKGNIIRERSAPIIQQDLKAVGMNVELEYMDFPTLMTKMENKELDMALLGMHTGMVDPDSNTVSFLHSSQFRPTGWNTASYEDAEMDRLLEAGGVEADLNVRKQIYDEVQEKCAIELPYIYLYYEQAIGATSGRLKNAIPNGLGIEWNIQDWEVEQ